LKIDKTSSQVLLGWNNAGTSTQSALVQLTSGNATIQAHNVNIDGSGTKVGIINVGTVFADTVNIGHAGEKITVRGVATISDTLVLTRGAGVAKVLTSDANGLASWATQQVQV
jgi:hypothetical protein